MFSHTAYGLGIRSDWQLPECGPGDGPADVTIRRTDVRRGSLQPVSDAWSIANGDDGVRLAHEDIGRFRLAGGRKVDVDPREGTPEATLRHYLLGPVLGALLHQRGRLVLHASGLAVDGRGVAFLGGGGAGKSTLVAAGHQRGHRLLADDVVAVAMGDPPTVSVGPPIVKLDPENAADIDVRSRRLPRPELGKDYYRLARGDAAEAAPLARCYVLEPGRPPGVEPLSPRDAALELVRHTYVAPLLDALGGRAANLEQCGRLAGTVPVGRLGTGDRPTALDRVLDAVERDLADAG